MLCSVVSRNRTVLLNDSYTIKQVRIKLATMGLRFSIKRTFQFYGLTFVEEHSFTSKYKNIFNLNDDKKYDDITLKELYDYRNSLTGSLKDNSRFYNIKYKR